MKKQNTIEVVSDFLNPFEKGVSYIDFLKAKGNKSVKEYCKDKLTEEQIQFIENELKIIKK